MTSVPANLTLIRNSFRDPKSLKDIKKELEAATTDYLMVVGMDDLVDVLEPLTGDVHYLQTHVGTARKLRYARPALAYDPLLLAQFNYIGAPIFHKSLVPLFPETAIEPWHALMLRAQGLGKSFSLLSGGHVVIEPWPRPQLSGAFAHFRTSFDPTVAMQHMPGILIEEVNQRPSYRLRDPRSGTFLALCRNCSQSFMDGLAGASVTVHESSTYEHGLLVNANAEYVAWFDGIAEPLTSKILDHLQIGLEFPNVQAISPRLVTEFSPSVLQLGAFWLKGGIYREFSPLAWASRTRDLGSAAPTDGCTTSYAILRKVP